MPLFKMHNLNKLLFSLFFYFSAKSNESPTDTPPENSAFSKNEVIYAHASPTQNVFSPNDVIHAVLNQLLS